MEVMEVNFEESSQPARTCKRPEYDDKNLLEGIHREMMSSQSILHMSWELPQDGARNIAIRSQNVGTFPFGISKYRSGYGFGTRILKYRVLGPFGLWDLQDWSPTSQGSGAMSPVAVEDGMVAASCHSTDDRSRSPSSRPQGPPTTK